MRISEGLNYYYNAAANNSPIEFFDCEEEEQSINNDNDNDIFFDCLEELPDKDTTLADDLKHTLFHAVNIMISSESEHLSLKLLHRSGLAIPLSALLSARACYRLLIHQEPIGNRLFSELPVLIPLILPHSEKLQSLACYIKNAIENLLGQENLSFIPAYNDRTGSAYLWLGLLAVLSQYYAAGHAVPAPRRPLLQAPLSLARLFTRITGYWRILCSAAGRADNTGTDGFGRLQLSPADKTGQQRERQRARLWARHSHHQIRSEQMAERYYGIGQKGAAGLVFPSVIGADSFASGTDVMLRLSQMWSSDLWLLPARDILYRAGRALLLMLNPLPMACAAPFGAAPAGAGIDLHTHVETLKTQGHYPPPEPACLGMQLTDSLKKEYPTLAGIAAQQQEDDSRDLTAIYRHALNRYWRRYSGHHALANLIALLNGLMRAEDSLTRREKEIFLHALGFSDPRFQDIAVFLFDINGTYSSDLFVIDARTHQRILLYLPRARRPFKSFADWRDMTMWFAEQIRDSTGREEILAHFALKDRWPRSAPFGMGDIGAELMAAADNPDAICQKRAPRSGALYELLTSQHRQRAWDDAGYLALPGQAPAKQSDGVIAPWLDKQFVLPIPPVSPETFAIGNQNRTDTPPTDPWLREQHPAATALTVLAANAEAILAADGQGGIRFSSPLQIGLDIFQLIITRELQSLLATPAGTAGETHVVEQLAVSPQRYEREIRMSPNGRLDSRLNVYLAGDEGQPPQKQAAIALYNKIVPLRFNGYLNAFEIFNIKRRTEAGYPVHINPASFWQFGRVAYPADRHKHNQPMTEYDFISVRLHKLLLEDIDNYCVYATNLTPANSFGIKQDLTGNTYLSLRGHHIKITPALAENTYAVNGKNTISLKIKHDGKTKKFILVPPPGNGNSRKKLDKVIAPDAVEIAADIQRTFRQGFRSADKETSRLALWAENTLLSAGLKKVVYYGLTETEILSRPHYSSPANTLRHIFTACDDILRHLSETITNRRERNNFYAALRLQNVGGHVQARAYGLFLDNLDKTRRMLKSHLADGLNRIWAANFTQSDLVVLSLKQDPLHRLWFNARTSLSRNPAGDYSAAHCRYGCNEISANQHIASVSLPGKHTGKTPFINPVREADFNLFVDRLWQGNITADEISALISLPEAATIQHRFFMSDKELARKLFRNKAMARARWLLADADYFTFLLLHLHAARRTADSCDHHDSDPHIRPALFMLAFQALPDRKMNLPPR